MWPRDGHTKELQQDLDFGANGRFNVVVDLTVLELWKPDKEHSYVNLSYLVI